MSVFMPDFMDMDITPIARALLEIRAMTASPFILPFSLRRKIINAESTTIGIPTVSGAVPKTRAIAIAPKATCERQSPIMEYLFRTKLTPKSAAHSDTKVPTINALMINGYVIISANRLNIGFTSEKLKSETAFLIFVCSTEKMSMSAEMQYMS